MLDSSDDSELDISDNPSPPGERILRPRTDQHQQASINVVLDKFKSMKKTDALPSPLHFDAGVKTKQVKVWYENVSPTNTTPKPLFQHFNYPIKSINCIPADPVILQDYDKLLGLMNKMYEILYPKRDEIRLAPELIVKGSFAVARIVPSWPDIAATCYGNFQRVILRQTYKNKKNASSLIKCYCVDQGNEAIVDFRELFLGTTDFARLPPKVLQAPLKGLEDYFMSTDLRHVLLYESFLNAAVITLSQKEKRQKNMFRIRMENSRFPGRNWIDVIKEQIERAGQDKTRYRYSIELQKIMKMNMKKNYISRDCIPFSSLTPIRTNNINFGSPKAQPVYLQVGAVLDVVVIGHGSIPELRLMPYATVEDELLSQFKTKEDQPESWFNKPSADGKKKRPAKPECPCHKDGSHFIVEHHRRLYRCQVVDKKYSCFNNRDIVDYTKRIKVLFLDNGHIEPVRGEKLKYLPSIFASYLPAQAVLAFWLHPADNGELIAHNWTHSEWSAFTSYIRKKRLTAIVLKTTQNDLGLNIIHVELYDPATSQKLEPKSKFWEVVKGDNDNWKTNPRIFYPPLRRPLNEQNK